MKIEIEGELEYNGEECAVAVTIGDGERIGIDIGAVKGCVWVAGADIVRIAKLWELRK